MRDTCVPSQDGRDVCADLAGGVLAQLGWGGTVTQVQEYDRELDAWREAFTARSGRTPTQPTTSRTAAPPESSWRTPIIVGAVAVTAVAIAYTISSLNTASKATGAA